MGTYLSTPVTEKSVEYGTGKQTKYGVVAMQGWRRNMEDSHISTVRLDNSDSMQIFGVFDGHGGPEVAKFCSKYLPTELEESQTFKSKDYATALIDVFHRIDMLLREPAHQHELEQMKCNGGSAESEQNDDSVIPSSSKEGNNRGQPQQAFEFIRRMLMSSARAGDSQDLDNDGNEDLANGSNVQAGCAATVVLMSGKQLYVANAGDSRAVICRTGKAHALSEDHKPTQTNERRRIENAGGFVTDIGGICRVNGNLNLSRAIGDLRYKTNTDIPAKDQIITAQPDIEQWEITDEDQFIIIACDGVWDVLSNQQAVDMVKGLLDQGLPPEEVGVRVLDHCLAPDPQDTKGVGCDNMTIIVTILNTNDEPTDPQTMQQPGSQQADQEKGQTQVEAKPT